MDRWSPGSTGPGSVVSGGNNTAGPTQWGRPYGAIDDADHLVNNPAAFDSLFQVHTENVPEDVRVRILEQHMMNMQKRLEACKEKRKTP